MGSYWLHVWGTPLAAGEDSTDRRTGLEQEHGTRPRPGADESISQAWGWTGEMGFLGEQGRAGCAGSEQWGSKRKGREDTPVWGLHLWEKGAKRLGGLTWLEIYGQQAVARSSYKPREGWCGRSGPETCSSSTQWVVRGMWYEVSMKSSRR